MYKSVHVKNCQVTNLQILEKCKILKHLPPCCTENPSLPNIHTPKTYPSKQSKTYRILLKHPEGKKILHRRLTANSLQCLKAHS